jgi:hypothetical protein
MASYSASVFIALSEARNPWPAIMRSRRDVAACAPSAIPEIGGSGPSLSSVQSGQTAQLEPEPFMVQRDTHVDNIGLSAQAEPACHASRECGNIASNKLCRSTLGTL